MLRNMFLSGLTVLTVLALAVTTSNAATIVGAVGDGKTSISYDSATGAWGLQPDGQLLGLFDIQSASGIFNAAATLPGSALFSENTNFRKSYAALSPTINADYNLGVISAPGLALDFLLQDLTLAVSGGFGTPNRDGDLVRLGGVVVDPPVITLVDLGEVEGSAGVINALLNASNGPNTWSALVPTVGSPALAATLGADGSFSWDPAGSAAGHKGSGNVMYSWTATATNQGGSDTDVAIKLTLIPEPATLSLIGLAMIGLVGLARRRG